MLLFLTNNMAAVTSRAMAFPELLANNRPLALRGHVTNASFKQ